MKVDSDRQRSMLDLAEADADLARLDHRASHLPADAAIADLTTRLEEARSDLVRSEISAEDLTREYRRINTEVTGMSDRETKDTALLTDGTLGAKALAELQHELTGLGRRRSVLEDELLEVMEQQEAVEAERQRAAATIAHLDEELTAAQQARTADSDEVLADRAVVSQRRDEIVAQAPEELLAVYDRLRATGCVGAGLLRARRCGACRMELDRGTLATISAADPDDVIRCEECGALLVRTAESGL